MVGTPPSMGGEAPFCPYCGHQNYLHNSHGCTHVEAELVECDKPDCTPDVLLTHGASHAHPRAKPCDCDHPHPLLKDDDDH